jgi:hypothetical protein
MANIFKSPLMAFLKEQNSLYYGKAEELRNAIEGWLSYIPQTFPHYTRHTVQHSDEIIVQLSKLLFEEDKFGKPVVELSPTEAYILIACAYLHDAGMVISDKEKATILLSEEWKSWTSENGGGAKRWYEIQEFRKGAEVAHGYRDFIADIQTRHLIAEFLRRTHHLRSASVITQHETMLGRFAFDDPIMLRTIADVCIAHGLRQHELDDKERFPERRDIRDDKVNVKFMAILLRIGDLLDISYDRACPLLLNAACPLPAESLAHWSQYQRIIHRLTAPDRIEIKAECETQEEHRFIQDWCQWLIDELREARFRMVRSARHSDWVPPKADFDSDIIIRPSKNASYIPSKWVFELDKDAVFQILIKDAYADPFTFIRELIQNALDAIRCQMYSEIIQDGKEPPEYPTQVDKEFRDRYPVKISLEEREMVNPLSGETETRQALIINDCGIGMDREIIQRYFLQVGRSYYTTEEFKRTYRFIPTSRFGVGFLSVFGTSDRVTVETYKPTSPNNDGPIRLILTGPRNYLLTDVSDRRTGGTRIEVLLRESLGKGKLTDIISQWCRRVEFPIIVNDIGLQTIIEAERPEQFTYELPDVTEENAKFLLRSFPINRPGIEGELYVFARITNSGESWVHKSWAEYSYPSLHPAAVAPQIPDSIICLHGIITHSPYTERSMIYRLDYRRSGNPTLSRETVHRYGRGTYSQLDADLQSRWEEILQEHLAVSQLACNEKGWEYKQKLSNQFPIPSFWQTVDGMIPLQSVTGKQHVSLAHILSIPVIGTITSFQSLADRMGFFPLRSKDDEPDPAWDSDNNFIKPSDLILFTDKIMKMIFAGRKATNLRCLGSSHLAIDWMKCDGTEPFWEESISKILLARLTDSNIIGFTIHPTIEYTYILNSNNEFVKWLIEIKKTCAGGSIRIKIDQFNSLMSLVKEAVQLPISKERLDKLISYVEAWRKLPGLEPEPYPPIMEFTEEMFDPRKIFPGPVTNDSEPSLVKTKGKRKDKQ